MNLLDFDCAVVDTKIKVEDYRLYNSNGDYDLHNFMESHVGKTYFISDLTKIMEKKGFIPRGLIASFTSNSLDFFDGEADTVEISYIAEDDESLWVSFSCKTPFIQVVPF